MLPPYKAGPPTDPPKYLIVEGHGLASERAAAESAGRPAAPPGPGHPPAADTPVGDTQIE